MTFSLGTIVATPGALDLRDKGVSLISLLKRHQKGDWGDLNEEDKKENDYSLTRHLRLLSSYITPHGKVWIITEADRSATTFLLPDEY